MFSNKVLIFQLKMWYNYDFTIYLFIFLHDFIFFSSGILTE